MASREPAPRGAAELGPIGLSFGKQLDWHLLQGTRPPQSAQQGKRWRHGEFAHAVGISDRQLRYWLKDHSKPNEIETVERLFFGQNQQDYGEWRIALRQAHDAARRLKKVQSSARGPKQKGNLAADEQYLDLHLFKFGGVTARVKIIDALLETPGIGYSDDLIVCEGPAPYVSVGTILQNSADTSLSALSTSFAANRGRWLGVAQAGRKQIWDYCDLVGFNNIDLLREGEQELKGFKIRTARTSYFDHRAIADCFKDMTPLEQATVVERHEWGSEVFGRLTAISCALITDDSKIIFSRRAKTLTSDPGMITCGVNEALKISDHHQDNSLSVPKRAILRGLGEEFGLANLADSLLDRVQVWALVLNKIPFEWYFYATADFRDCGPKYAVQQLERNLLTGKARDKFENESIFSLSFELPEILQFVRRHRNEITEYGATLPIMAALFDGQG